MVAWTWSETEQDTNRNLSRYKAWGRSQFTRCSISQCVRAPAHSIRMSLIKRKLRIQRTLDFLERDEAEKELRRLRHAQELEENSHKKDILVIDSGRPVYFWHWKVHKNACDHGYMFIKTRFKINVSGLTGAACFHLWSGCHISVRCEKMCWWGQYEDNASLTLAHSLLLCGSNNSQCLFGCLNCHSLLDWVMKSVVVHVSPFI